MFCVFFAACLFEIIVILSVKRKGSKQIYHEKGPFFAREFVSIPPGQNPDKSWSFSSNSFCPNLSEALQVTRPPVVYPMNSGGCLARKAGRDKVFLASAMPLNCRVSFMEPSK